MILRPQSLETFKTVNQMSYNNSCMNGNEFRKKVQNFSFLPNQKIGRGYSSIVYKGQNDLTKQQVAIKVIELKSLKDQNTKRFLQNQLQCLRKLNHDNNLRYINSFITSNNCYIITQLYSGGDLAKILKQKSHFNQSETYQIFHQFYQGYTHFHSKGYIHRDIKPSNILVQSKENGKSTYVIADFGFIKHLDENPRDTFNVGTPVYMSPQTITSNIYTAKSDIWSMGVMLFQLIYGFMPFQSKGQTQLKRQICNKEIKLQEVQQKCNISTSSQFKTFLLSCLRKNPQNRISLQQIKVHPWFKKHSLYDLDLRMKQLSDGYRKSIISISKQRASNQQNKYQFIGNQAVKREKSLQSNNFSLKSYSKNPLKKLNRQSDIHLQRRKQKSHHFENSSIDKGNNLKKQSQSVRKQPQIYFSHFPAQKIGSIALTQSPKINIFTSENSKLNLNKLNLNKSSSNNKQPRSSLLEGMKGIIKIKNSQLLKINYDFNKRNTKQRQSYKKIDVVNFSTDISSSQKQNIDYSHQKNQVNTIQNQSPLITDFVNKSPESINELKKQNNLNAQNTRRKQNITASTNFHNEQSETKMSFNSPAKVEFSVYDFCLKALHTLRFIFQTLSLLKQFQGQKQNYFQIKQCLLQFFSIYFTKLNKSIVSKKNLFQLKNWAKFIQSSKFQAFKEVMQKYNIKYSSSLITERRLCQIQCEQKDISSLDLQKFQRVNYNILKFVERITAANKQLSKKSFKSSSALNNEIKLVFNLHKCTEYITLIIKSKNHQFFQKISPNKDIEQMTQKNKDPFKIPKILIQLKKKLIFIEPRILKNSNEYSEIFQPNTL